MLRTYLLVFSIWGIGVNGKSPIVEISNGKLRGEIMLTPNNRTFYAFRGIPYAKPPLGELRFQPPQKPDNWQGVLDSDAKDRMCIQMTKAWLPIESEDCLYIHVYTPQIPKKEQQVSLPVMYVIHGGAFVYGTPTPHMIGPQYLMDYDVIVVSVGYRLGFLGFVSTDDLHSPGNNGLKDQQFGLKWVQQNIHKFGGDPNRVTIFGESAGAASVGFQLLGTKAEGLYIGAILNSGSPLGNWAVQNNPKEIAYRLGKQINPNISENNTSTFELMKFFKTLTVSEIKHACVDLFGEGILEGFYNTISGFLFGPTIEPEHDDAFLSKSPYQKFLTGDFQVVPSLLGSTSEEFLFVAQDAAFGNIVADFDKNSENYVPTGIRTVDLATRKLVGRKIRDIYDTPGSLNQTETQFLRYLSDGVIVRPTLKQAELESKYTDVYFYEFGYSGKMGDNFLGPNMPDTGKVGHYEDMMYLFHCNDSKDLYLVPEEDRITMKRMLTLWTNFVKYQNPTPERIGILQNITWPKIQSLEKTPYLNINKKLEVRYNYRRKMMKEYQNLFDTYAVLPRNTY